MGGNAQLVVLVAHPAVAAFSAALLSMVGTVQYLRDVHRGQTRPHRGTWAIWSVIGVIGAASHAADGARWSLVMIAGQALTTVAVLLLGWSRGVGSITSMNAVMFAFAAVGVGGWLYSSDPTVATVWVVFADALGVAMMLPKTWADPFGETLMTFALATVSGVLGLVAVGGFDLALLLLPGYLFLANGLTTVIITARRAVGPARVVGEGRGMRLPPPEPALVSDPLAGPVWPHAGALRHPVAGARGQISGAVPGGFTET